MASAGEMPQRRHDHRGDAERQVHLDQPADGVGRLRPGRGAEALPRAEEQARGTRPPSPAPGAASRSRPGQAGEPAIHADTIAQPVSSISGIACHTMRKKRRNVSRAAAAAPPGPARRGSAAAQAARRPSRRPTSPSPADAPRACAPECHGSFSSISLNRASISAAAAVRGAASITPSPAAKACGNPARLPRMAGSGVCPARRTSPSVRSRASLPVGVRYQHQRHRALLGLGQRDGALGGPEIRRAGAAPGSARGPPRARPGGHRCRSASGLSTISTSKSRRNRSRSPDSRQPDTSDRAMAAAGRVRAMRIACQRVRLRCGSMSSSTTRRVVANAADRLPPASSCRRPLSAALL